MGKQPRLFYVRDAKSFFVWANTQLEMKEMEENGARQ